MAYLILQKVLKFKFRSGVFEQAAATKNMGKIQIFFREAQKELRCTGELTIEEVMNHTKMINLAEQGVQQALEQLQMMQAEDKENEEPAKEVINMTQEETMLTKKTRNASIT
eukprot:3404003-Ditylum_brightwellii.AAC.1